MHVVMPEQPLVIVFRAQLVLSGAGVCDCVQSSARSVQGRGVFELEFGSAAAAVQKCASHGEVQRLCLEWGEGTDSLEGQRANERSFSNQLLTVECFISFVRGDQCFRLRFR